MQPFYALYIGSTKIVGIRGTVEKEKNAVVDTIAKVAAIGFDKGIIVDIEKACSYVREVLLKLVDEKEMNRIGLHVILSSNLVSLFSCSSSIYFGDMSRTITQLDIDRVIAQTRATATIPLNEQILLAEPEEFMINDLAGIRTPRDLEARRLAVTLSLFTAQADTIRNIQKVFDRLEISVQAYYPRVVTAAASVLRPEEERDGIVLIDIAGHATSISCYNNHVLDFYEVIPFGGECISLYLAQNLNISLLEARRLKEQYGSAALLERFEDEIIPVIDVFGKTRFNINKKRLYDQIHIAAKELVDKIYLIVREKRKQHMQLCGAVVTGGGARLEGLLDLLEKALGIPVRLGSARAVSGHAEALSNAAYAPQLGLLSYLIEQGKKREEQYHGKNTITRKYMKVKAWIQENF